ncbi:hypothetical protein BKA93DRAFT_72955 [Sparassis latifolia]
MHSSFMSVRARLVGHSGDPGPGAGIHPFLTTLSSPSSARVESGLDAEASLSVSGYGVYALAETDRLCEEQRRRPIVACISESSVALSGWSSSSTIPVDLTLLFRPVQTDQLMPRATGVFVMWFGRWSRKGGYPDEERACSPSKNLQWHLSDRGQGVDN